MQITIIQEKDNKGNGIQKVFGLISLFASVAMSATKSIILNKKWFLAKLIHHEERDKSYPEIPPTSPTPQPLKQRQEMVTSTSQGPPVNLTG